MAVSRKGRSRKKEPVSSAGIVWQWIRDNVQTLDATGGIKPFPDYPFIGDLIAALSQNRILIVAKSRQMMATWTVCAYTLYHMLYSDPGLYLFLSKGARDTGELLKRLRVIISLLPEEERSSIKITSTEISSGNGSRLLALPATEDAVRMHSPTAVFWDEMAFTPHSEDIWTAVKPAIDSGGCFFGISTPNGTDNIFHQLYTDHTNGFGKICLHWSQHPKRDEAWKKEAQRGLSLARWRQEYEVDFNILADRVYDEFDPDSHILPMPFLWQRNAGRTFRSIDFGYRHPYVIWAHLNADGEMIIFDEWESWDATVEEMANAIKAIDQKHGLSEADVRITTCDPAGAAVSDTGVSAVERLQRMGYKLLWRTSQIMTGVELVKSLLKDASGRVRIRFSPQTERTLYHLRHYRWEPGKDRPVKDDGHDHAMDALRYLVINIIGQQPVGWTGAKIMGAKWEAR